MTGLRRQSFMYLTLLGVLIWSGPAAAQSATGGIRGVVTDASGAALPGAGVTARNVATGVESKTTATGEGLYAIPRILPGTYQVAIEVRGFKRAEVTDVEVSVGKVHLEPRHRQHKRGLRGQRRELGRGLAERAQPDLG